MRYRNMILAGVLGLVAILVAVVLVLVTRELESAADRELHDVSFPSAVGKQRI